MPGCRKTCLLIFGFLLTSRLCEAQSDFSIEQRVNAHGDEYTSIARTSDSRYLAVGTEKGEILVWGIAEGRILRRLNQGSPIHALVTAGAHAIIAAGGPHSGGREFGVIRKWNIDDGTFQELTGSGSTTIMALSGDSATGVVVASTLAGRIASWNSNSGEFIGSVDLKQGITGVAISGRTVAVSVVNLEEVMKAAVNGSGSVPSGSILILAADQLNAAPRRIVPQNSGRLWGPLSLQPNGPLLAAQYTDRSGLHIAVMDVVKGMEIANLEGKNAEWARDGELIVFASDVPIESVRIDSNGRLSKSALLESGKWHAAGNPDGMAGSAVSSDGSRIWEVFRLNSTLAQCDLSQKKCEVIQASAGLLFTMDISENGGVPEMLATGGDDGYVRVWKQPDFSLIKEFHAVNGVPQGVALMSDGRHVVFSSSSGHGPTEVVSGDIDSGEVHTLFSVPSPFIRVVRASGGFVYGNGMRLVLSNPAGEMQREYTMDSKIQAFAVSPNGEWIGVADEKGVLYCFEVKSGKRIASSNEKVDGLKNIAISNNGESVYTTESGSSLKYWDTRRNNAKKIATVRGQPTSLFVSGDGRQIAVGGNHRDITVFDSRDGEAIAELRTVDSDFLVTNAWISGNRLIFTTDVGILLSGTLGQ